jgi:hypothetical protein
VMHDNELPTEEISILVPARPYVVAARRRHSIQ